MSLMLQGFSGLWAPSVGTEDKGPLSQVGFTCHCGLKTKVHVTRQSHKQSPQYQTEQVNMCILLFTVGIQKLN